MATAIGALRGFETRPYKSQGLPQGFVHNGTHYYVSGAGYSKKVDEPGRRTRYVSIFREEFDAAYLAFCAELDDAHEQAVLEAQDWYQDQAMLDDIRSNAPEGW